MTWDTSNRAERLPADWQSRRLTVLARAHGRCEARQRNGQRCRDRATDVDHIEHGDDHDLANLQALCRWHHARKSSAEGNQSRRRYTNKRPPEAHPGVIK